MDNTVPFGDNLWQRRTAATSRRALDSWLAISWAFVVVILLIVRWLDIAAPSRVLSVRVVAVFTILVAVLSMARDPVFRVLLPLAVTSVLMAAAVVALFDPPLDGGLITELVVPSTGYVVMGLMAARIVAAALGEAIGHPYDCECNATNSPA